MILIHVFKQFVTSRLFKKPTKSLFIIIKLFQIFYNRTKNFMVIHYFTCSTNKKHCLIVIWNNKDAHGSLKKNPNTYLKCIIYKSNVYVSKMCN